MAVTLVRRNSDTPNVRNSDDARLLRYASYGKSGIIKDYAQEVALTQGGANILHIGTGEIIHQGWQVDIDASGIDLTLDNRDSVEYYTVYLQISLAVSNNQTATIAFLKSNNAFPTVTPGDDLTTNPDGTSRLEIAHVYLVPSSSTFTITSLLEVIPYNPKRFEQTNVGSATNPVYIDGLGEPKPITSYQGTAQYANYASQDTSKGTIEERLTRLGFRVPAPNTYPLVVGTYGTIGGITLSVTGSTTGSHREGNKVILKLNISLSYGGEYTTPIQRFYKNGNSATTSGALLPEYRPSQEQIFYIPSPSLLYRFSIGSTNYDSTLCQVLQLTIGTDGKFTLEPYRTPTLAGSPSLINCYGASTTISVGYTADPITS